MKQLDPTAFVTAWQGSSTVDKVATHLGITVKHASAVATRFRKKGVRLKRMNSSSGAYHRLDVEALNKLIEG